MEKCKVGIVRENGQLNININGKSFVPLSFKSFRPNPKNVSEFYNAGVRLFSVLSSGVNCALGVPYSLFGESFIGEHKYDFSVIDRQMDMFIQNAPEGYFAVMLQLDTRQWYLKQNPETPNSFTHLSQVACDDKWKSITAEYLKKAIEHIECKYGDRVYAYFLLCGTTTEWMSDLDFEAPHPIKNEGFKRWLNSDSASLPSKERMSESGNVFLSESENDVYLARKFHNELIADLILYFSKEAQSVINHQKLLGVYYGYLFELGAPRLFNAGSLLYEKVFLSPDIDIISSPSSYAYRGLFDPSAFMVTQRTLNAHNKIYFLEFDHITHVAPSTIRDSETVTDANNRIVYIPGADSRCKNLTETLNLMYRDFLLCTANGAALWWFDMFDGWFRSDEMMAAIERVINIADELSRYPQESRAEIAVFAEGEAMLRTRKNENLASICLGDIRRSLAECGAPYDLYSISDISLDFMDKYKAFIFINQYDISKEIKEQINQKCKKNGNTVLWLYAPDYANGGKCGVDNIYSITDLKVGESATSHGELIYNNKAYNYPLSAPYFEVTDADSIPLAHFKDGSVAAAKKVMPNYFSIYLATANLPSLLLRDILKGCGVHLYSDNPKVYTYVNSLITGVYNATDNDAIINLKSDGIYKDYISGESFVCKNGRLTLPKKDINAYLLRKLDN